MVYSSWFLYVCVARIFCLLTECLFSRARVCLCFYVQCFDNSTCTGPIKPFIELCVGETSALVNHRALPSPPGYGGGKLHPSENTPLLEFAWLSLPSTDCPVSWSHVNHHGLCGSAIFRPPPQNPHPLADHQKGHITQHYVDIQAMWWWVISPF